MNEHKQKTERNILRVIFIVFILINTLPVIFASAFSTMSSDDFSNSIANGITAYTEISGLPAFLSRCVKAVEPVYMTWGGIFFSIFVTVFFSPLNYFRNQPYHWFMVFNALFTCASFLYLLIVYWKYLTRDKAGYSWLPLLMAACGIYMLVNYDAHPEIFFWFTSAASYSIPLSFVFLSLALFIQSKRNGKKACFIAACVIGFFSMGGTQAVTGAGCSLSLLFCAYEFLKNKHIEKNTLILFLVMLAGALVNVAAPGNYERHTVIDYSGLHPWAALEYTLVSCHNRIQWLGNHTNFAAVLTVIFLAGVVIGGDKIIASGPYVFLSIAALFLPVITGFPVALGYSNRVFPDRCVFLLDAAIILVFTNAALAAGNLAACKLRAPDTRKSLCMGISLLAIALFCITKTSLQNTVSYQILQELHRGTYQNSYKECQQLFDYLKTQKGKDVVLTESQYPQPIPLYRNFYLSNKPGNWINRAVSQYFELTSVSYEQGDSEPQE